MSLFTLERRETDRGYTRWIEGVQVYRTAEDALEAAGRLWEDDEVLVEAIRVKRTEILCTLAKPEAENGD